MSINRQWGSCGVTNDTMVRFYLLELSCRIYKALFIFGLKKIGGVLRCWHIFSQLVLSDSFLLRRDEQIFFMWRTDHLIALSLIVRIIFEQACWSKSILLTDTNRWWFPKILFFLHNCRWECFGYFISHLNLLISVIILAIRLNNKAAILLSVCIWADNSIVMDYRVINLALHFICWAQMYRS